MPNSFSFCLVLYRRKTRQSENSASPEHGHTCLNTEIELFNEAIDRWFYVVLYKYDNHFQQYAPRAINLSPGRQTQETKLNNYLIYRDNC